MANRQIEYSVVIPVYNSEGSISELCSRINLIFEKLRQSYEIILVDDDSHDNSWEIMKKLKKDSRIKIIRLANNFGQHNALMCGFNFTQGEYIITLDDDLQHPPEEIPKLINKIKEGYDMVYGVYESKKHAFGRNLGSKFVQWVYGKVLGIKGEITAFRIIRHEIICQIINYNKNFTFIDGFIAWYTKNIGYTRVEHEERKMGKSNYNLKKLLILTLNLCTNFSILPLQIASFLGILFSGLGFLMGLTYFIMKIFAKVTISGFATVIVVITIFAGVQLLILGLIGEYLGRIQLSINNKPQFCIREKMID